MIGLIVSTEEGQGLVWRDLDEGAKDQLAEFLLAVNYEISFVDGRRTKSETAVERSFQTILAGSRSDLTRQALFRLSEQFGAVARAFDAKAATGDLDFMGPRIGSVRSILESLRLDEAKRFLTAVFFVGIATAEADGPLLGAKTSPKESHRLDSILYSLGLGLAGSEETLLSWINEGG